MIFFSFSTPSLRLLSVTGYFLLGAMPSLRELANARIAGQVNDEARGTALGMNETVFALARSIAAVLAGALFTLEPRAPFWASLALLPIGMILIVRLPPALTRDHFVAMATPSNVIIESTDD